MKLHMEGSTRRSGLRWAGLEPLEDRALLSVMSFTTAVRQSWPGGSHLAAEISSGEVVESKIRVTKAEGRPETPVNAPRPSENPNQSLQERLAIDWNDWEGKASLPLQQVGSSSTEVVADELDAVKDAALDAQTAMEFFDFLDIIMDDPNADESSNDPNADGSSPSPDWSEPIIKPNGRIVERMLALNVRTPPLSPALTSINLVNTDIPASELPSYPSREVATRSRLHLDWSIPSTTPEGGVVGETRTPVRAEVLEGAAAFNWAMLDQELRQFLSRVGGLSSSSDGLTGGSSSVPLWVAILAASFVAREAANGKAWWHRRLARKERPSNANPESFPGPWPLGPP